MYYIRLLHGPQISPLKNDKKWCSLVVVVAITNDLGEQRFSPPASVPLSITITSSSPGLPNIVLRHNDGGSFYWASGMWIRKAEPRFPISQARTLFSDHRTVRVSIDTTSSVLSIRDAAHLVPPRGGKAERKSTAMVFPVHCQCYWNEASPGQSSSYDRDWDVLRQLALPVLPCPLLVPLGEECQVQEPRKQVVVEVADDIGDNIPRHVWDSGITMIAFYADLCLRSPLESSQAAMFPVVKSILQKKDLSVIELGAGVGSQAIGLAAVLSNGEQRQTLATILVTDIEDARKRAEANIKRLVDGGCCHPNVSLSYENLDWEGGAMGVFGSTASSRAWDLILVSDCTYNYDTIPSLVDTFEALHKANVSHAAASGATTLSPILLSTKQRHDSETIFFSLVEEAGWKVRETTRIPFPVTQGAIEEEMEVYLFEKS